jgi:hypothetical protein
MKCLQQLASDFQQVNWSMWGASGVSECGNEVEVARQTVVRQSGARSGLGAFAFRSFPNALMNWLGISGMFVRVFFSEEAPCCTELVSTLFTKLGGLLNCVLGCDNVYYKTTNFGVSKDAYV